MPSLATAAQVIEEVKGEGGARGSCFQPVQGNVFSADDVVSLRLDSIYFMATFYYPYIHGSSHHSATRKILSNFFTILYLAVICYSCPNFPPSTHHDQCI